VYQNDNDQRNRGIYQSQGNESNQNNYGVNQIEFGNNDYRNETNNNRQIDGNNLGYLKNNEEVCSEQSSENGIEFDDENEEID